MEWHVCSDSLSESQSNGVACVRWLMSNKNLHELESTLCTLDKLSSML